MTPGEIKTQRIRKTLDTKRKTFYDRVLYNKVSFNGFGGHEDIIAEYMLFAEIVESNFFKYFFVWA